MSLPLSGCQIEDFMTKEELTRMDQEDFSKACTEYEEMGGESSAFNDNYSENKSLYGAYKGAGY